MNIEVLISLENKTLRSAVVVDIGMWRAEPFECVQTALKQQQGMDLDSVPEHFKIEYSCRDIVDTVGSDTTSEGHIEIQLIDKPATRVGQDLQVSMIDAFPVLNQLVECPACTPAHWWFLSNMIQHLNDDHCWTRANIADWLETLDMDLGMNHG